MPCKEPEKIKKRRLEVLPIAPPNEPPVLTPSQLEKVREREETILRRWRSFLRLTVKDLYGRREFMAFRRPVNRHEVRDYYEIITTPMDLSTLSNKIDLNRYKNAREFLDDVDLIVKNALEYNPLRDSKSLKIRRHARHLGDTAHHLIDETLDIDLERLCQNVHKDRLARGEDVEELEVMELSKSSRLKNVGSESGDDNSKNVEPALDEVSCGEETSSKVKLKGKAECEVTKKRKKKKKKKKKKGVLPEISDGKTSKPPHNAASANSTERSSRTSIKTVTNHSLFVEGQESIRGSESTKGSESSAELVMSPVRSELDISEENVVPPVQTPPEEEEEEGEEEEEEENEPPFVVDTNQLELILSNIVQVTNGYSVEDLIRLHNEISWLVHSHREAYDKSWLLKELSNVASSIPCLRSTSYRK